VQTLRVYGIVSWIAVVLGCSSDTTPSTWHYTVNFESVAAAVSVDTLEVDLFKATTDDVRCDVLVEARRTKAPLPTAVASIPATPLCALRGGGAGVTVAYGKYSVLVVAKHQGQDWLIGCNTQYVTPDEDPGTLPIELTNFDQTVQVPATQCQTLGARCAGGCK
jgi:hypothetical protein